MDFPSETSLIEIEQGSLENLKVSQDSTECRWLRQSWEAAAFESRSIASAYMATQMSFLRKTAGDARLKRKKMAEQNSVSEAVSRHSSAAS
jgi:hypothetical protein